MPRWLSEPPPSLQRCPWVPRPHPRTCWNLQNLSGSLSPHTVKTAPGSPEGPHALHALTCRVLFLCWWGGVSHQLTWRALSPRLRDTFVHFAMVEAASLGDRCWWEASPGGAGGAGPGTPPPVAPAPDPCIWAHLAERWAPRSSRLARRPHSRDRLRVCLAPSRYLISIRWRTSTFPQRSIFTSAEIDGFSRACCLIKDNAAPV